MNVSMELDLIRITASIARKIAFTPEQKAMAAFPNKEDEALRIRYAKTLARKEARK